jgi:hypothetical protein
MVCAWTALTFTFLGVVTKLKISYFLHGKILYLGTSNLENCVWVKGYGVVLNHAHQECVWGGVKVQLHTHS